MQKIKARVFYRIPLVGGATDYPEFYKKYGAQSVCCAIDKYLSVTIETNACGGLNIESKADLPWGMGLGSSGAFNSALILALARLRKRHLTKIAVSRLAYNLETGIDMHGTGRQDSIACLFSGISKITYHRNDSVKVDRISLSVDWQRKLSDRLLLFDIGIRREARHSIKDFQAKKNQPLLHEIAKLPNLLLCEWQLGNFEFLGDALNLQENYRSQLSPSCKSPRTDKILSTVRKHGAGARLTGAGLGCLLCYCPQEKKALIRDELKLKEIPFSILW